MAMMSDPELMALLARRLNLGATVSKRLSTIRTHLDEKSFSDTDLMDKLLRELEEAREAFSTQHQEIAAKLPLEDPDMTELHVNADELEQRVSKVYDRASAWIAETIQLSTQSIPPDPGDDQASGTTEPSAVVTDNAPAPVTTTAPDIASGSQDDGSGARSKKDSRKSSERGRDLRGAGDTKASSKAIFEIRDLLGRRTAEYDRMEQDNYDKSHTIQYLERQRNQERQNFLLQIQSMEKQMEDLRFANAKRLASTPSRSQDSRSVSFDDDNVSRVVNQFADRDSMHNFTSRVKSVCNPLHAVNVPFVNDPVSNVTPVVNPAVAQLIDNANNKYSGPDVTSCPPVNDTFFPTNTVPSQGYVDSSRVSMSVGGSEASVLAGLMSQNNHLFKSFLDDSKAIQQTHRETTDMPKSKLQIFHGNPLQFWMFTKTFEDLVGSSTMRAAKKLNSLITHCGDEVKKVLAGCQLMDPEEGYDKAKKLLKAKYGNPFLISQAWKSKIAEYPRISSPELLESYAEDLTCCYNTLSEMGHISEFNNSDCLSIISSKLDNGLRAKWRRAHRAALKKNVSGNFQELVELISLASDEQTDPIYSNKRLDSLVTSFGAAPLQFSGRGSSVAAGTKEQKRSKPSVFASSFDVDKLIAVDEDDRFNQQIILMATEVAGRTCNMCSGSHYISDCEDFIKLVPKERLLAARRKRLCLLCLNTGHYIDSCPHKNWKCQVKGCIFRHHNLLHGSFSIQTSEKKSYSISGKDQASVNLIDLNEEPGVSNTNLEVDVCINVTDVGVDVDIFKTITLRYAALPIAPIIVYVGKQSIVTYALLDPGSTATICTDRIVDLLRPESKGTAMLTINTISGKRATQGNIYDFEVRGCHGNETLPMFEVVALQKMPISNSHITAASDLQMYPHLASLPITKVEAQHVDFLVGQDNAHLLKPTRTIDGAGIRDPFAVITPLGWTIYGLKDRMAAIETKQVSLNYTAITDDNPFTTLERQVERMWDLDKVPTCDPMSPVNRAVIKMWDEQIKIVDGYIQLPIPLKKPVPDFPNNRPAVLARLRSLGKRLTKNPALHKMYKEAMQINFDKGYAVQVFHTPAPGHGWNLTQLPVEHKRKPGVARPVWNGGFVYQGRSLNDEVHQGPDFTNKIVSVLVNFRLLPVGIMGDIKAMYNQVRVPPEQRDLMRFLYWKDGDPEKEVIDCCLCYHMFGGGWSPSVCSYALRKTIELAKVDPLSETARTILKAFYVDDCVKSVVDAATGIHLFTQITSVLGQVHFDFTKLVSSSEEVNQAFPAEKRAPDSVDLDFDGGRINMQCSLGQRWQPGKDVFCFVAKFNMNPLTRREMLSTLSTLYDPLGLSTPFLIPAKRLLQELSKRGLSWDEPVPEDVAVQWGRWVMDAVKIKNLEIPRWVGLKTLKQRVWLVHFCDASEIAYGDVCYICTVDEDNKIITANLLITRSRLAPMKSQSIPRLELCAAVVAAQLDEAVREFLDVVPERSLFWSDSTLVLRYINSPPTSFKTFTANRISVIQQLTDKAAWRHVPSELNPADILSRGVTAEELNSNKMWLVGPPFLTMTGENWPDQPEFLNTELPEEELKREKCIYTTVLAATPAAKEQEPHLIVKLWTDISSWSDLVRRVAWILRAVEKFKIKKSKSAIMGTTELDVEEYTRAEVAVVRKVQETHLSDVEKRSSTFQKLFPRMRDDMICVGGRLMRSTLSTEFKQPFVLPADNTPTKLYVLHCHEEVYHAGVSRTLMQVRKRAWILTGRKAVKAVLSKCVICKRFKSPVMSQVMAELPAYRLKANVRPFSYVGIDYLGPLEVKINRSMVKRYICVIVCSCTRAIHLEPSSALTTSSFLNAFARFSARRGKPLQVLSDNGTNFVGAKAELDRETTFWNSEEVVRHLTDKGVAWKFNPPAASHFGGMWERHMRTIRSLLLFMTGGHRLSDEVFQTTLCLIEASLNSRPLTKLNDDPGDPSPLTPNHILQGDCVDPVRGVFFEADALRATWKQAQRLADVFWKRWTLEYLADLQKRTKWLSEKENLTVGSLVLIANENLPRHSWPLGLVTRVFEGSDGFVRAAELKTAKGTLTRPIVKLVLLEADLHVG